MLCLLVFLFQRSSCSCCGASICAVPWGPFPPLSTSLATWPSPFIMNSSSLQYFTSLGEQCALVMSSNSRSMIKMACFPCLVMRQALCLVSGMQHHTWGVTWKLKCKWNTNWFSEICRVQGVVLETQFPKNLSPKKWSLVKMGKNG